MFRRNPATVVVSALAILALSFLAARLYAQVPPAQLSIGEGRYGLATNPNETYNLLKCSTPPCTARSAWTPVFTGLLPSQIPVTVTYGSGKEEYSWEACVQANCVWRSWDRFVHDPSLVPVPPSDVRKAQPWIGLNAGFTASRGLPYPQPNTAGCLALVAVRVGSPTAAITVIDSQANGYAIVRDQIQQTDGHRAALLYAKNLRAGPNTVTVRHSTSSTLYYALGEYCGLSTSAPFDAVTSAFGNSNTPTSGSVATSGARLAIGVGSAAFQPAWTAGPFNTLQVSVAGKLAVEDRLGSAQFSLPSPIMAGFGLSVADNWTAIVATFK